MAFNNNEVARKWAKNRGKPSNEYDAGKAKRITFSESAPPPGAFAAGTNSLSSYGPDLSDHAQKQIKEAYASTFANSYDYSVDQERMAKGLMPTAFDKKYQDTELDRLLYRMGLPSAADLPQAVDDYNQRTAPERQYRRVYNEIGKDLTPYMDPETGALSEEKLLDFVYGKFGEEGYADLAGAWKQYKDTGDYDTHEEMLIAQTAQQDPDTYNIKRLVSDLNAAINESKQRQETDLAMETGIGVTPGIDVEANLPKVVGRSSVNEMPDIPILRTGALGAAHKDSEADTAKQAEEEAYKAELAKQDAELRAAVDFSLQKHLPGGLGAEAVFEYSPELQAQVDAYVKAQEAKGVDGFTVDQTLRRSNLGMYMHRDEAMPENRTFFADKYSDREVRNYAIELFKEQGMDAQAAAAYYDALPLEEKQMYRADMSFDNRVHTDISQEIGRTLFSVPVRAGLDIVNSAFSFADMTSPVSQTVDAVYAQLQEQGIDIENPLDGIRNKLNEAAYEMDQYGTSENHAALNVVSEVGKELVRMYALNAAGIFSASKLGSGMMPGSATTAVEKGKGMLLNVARKSFGARSMPFIASSMGSYYNKAIQDGATRSEATAFGLLAGTVEGVLEGIGADEMFNKTFSAGMVERMVSGGKKLLNEYGMKGINLVASMLGNGLEEGASYALSGIAEMAIYNPEWEFNSTEFWESMGMGALIGTVGAIITMPETSRSYQNLRGAIDDPSTARAKIDAAYAAYQVENMPREKYEGRKQDAIELTQDEYRNASREHNKAILDESNIQKQYDKQVASADERIAAAKKTVDDLVARKDALDPNNPRDVQAIGQVCKEIASAKITLKKTIESAEAAKQTARKEYESAIANARHRKAVTQRQLDDHNIAYDLRMQQMMARQDIERSLAELNEIEAQETAIYERLANTTDISETQALEQMLESFDERRTALNDTIDEATHTEEWLAMENKQTAEAWANDAEWQQVLQEYAENKQNYMTRSTGRMVNLTSLPSTITDRFRASRPVAERTAAAVATSPRTPPQGALAEEDDPVVGYAEAVDQNLVAYVEMAAQNKEQNMRPYMLMPVSDRAAQDIKTLIGVDATGFKTALEQKQAQHIVKDHGKEGKADQSMANMDDVGRIQFVLDNYDTISNGGRVKGYSEPVPGTKYTRTARSVVYEKKVNGHYYVVEAVPDASRKTAFIVSAYQNKKGTGQLADAEAPTRDAQDGSSRVPNVNIPQSSTVAQEADAQNLGIINQDVQEAFDAVRRTGRRVYQNFVSGQAPLERIGKKQTGIANGKATVTDLIQMARAARGGVEHILFRGLTDRNGNDLGRGSWKDLVDSMPKGEAFAAFQDYLLNLHNIDRMSLEERGYGKNKPVLPADEVDADGNQRPLTAEESAAKVQEYENAHPEFRQIADNLNSWWDTFMRRWAVNGELLSESAYDAMRAMYSHYVPTYRVDEGTPGSSSSRSGTQIRISDATKAAKGSLSEVKDIRDTFADIVNKIVVAERKNEVLLSLYNYAAQYPEAAAVDGVMIQNEDGNAPEMDIDTFDNLEQETLEQTKDGRYLVRARSDGEIVTMQVSKDVFEAIDLLMGSTANDSAKAKAQSKVLQNLRRVGNFIKGGITTYSPFFGITNAVRDFQTSFINSDSGALQYFGNIGNAVSQMAQRGEHWKNFQALGGKSSGYVGSQTGFMKNAFSEPSLGKRAVQKAKDIMSGVGEYTESIFRFSEYLQGIKKHGDTPDGRRKAIQMAADVSVNFSRNAPVTKMLDSFTLYLNAQVQGIDKLARQIKNKPLQTLGKNVPFVALAAFLLKGLGNEENPHYQNLTNYVKDSNYLIPNVFGERDSQGFPTTFIKLPKSREYGAMIVALFERSARLADGESFESAFADWLPTVATNFAPGSPITENMFAPATVFSTNKNYFGGDVVPTYMLDDPVTEQYDAQTSMVARRISEILYGMGVEAAPLHIDYVINQYGGFYGGLLTSATAGDSGGFGRALLNTVEDKFVADPLYSSGVTSKFYDVLDEALAASEDAKERRTEMGIEVESKDELAYNDLKNAKADISALRKEERELIASEKDSPSRKNKINEIRREINDIAKAAVEEWEKVGLK